jgi:dienelactone hydrolase
LTAARENRLGSAGVQSPRVLCAFTIAISLSTGCGTATVVDLEPDDGRSGIDGLDGPYGVSHASFRAPARATDVIHYEVIWPSTEDGEFDESAAPCPVVMFIHGGLVHPDQYRWIGKHLSSRGYCVVAPEHDLQLAIFESDNASLVMDDLERRPRGPFAGLLSDRIAVMGHSLGGAVASFRWVADARFDALALLASWPSEGTDVESQDRPSLSIIGSEDKEGEAVEQAHTIYERFPQPAWFGVIDGMNHYDWVDGASDRELRGDGVPTRPQSETRRDALRVLDAWLDAHLRDDAAAQQALDAHAFPNVSETP